MQTQEPTILRPNFPQAGGLGFDRNQEAAYQRYRDYSQARLKPVENYAFKIPFKELSEHLLKYGALRNRFLWGYALKTTGRPLKLKEKAGKKDAEVIESLSETGIKEVNYLIVLPKPITGERPSVTLTQNLTAETIDVGFNPDKLGSRKIAQELADFLRAG